MEKLTAFVSQHLSEDTARLILNRDKWPEIDMDLAVNCIESRRKLRGKVQEWYNEPSLVFPAKLSAEQCSSSATAAYKASFAGRIAGKEGWRIVDLTGGLGVDSWFFSRKAGKVLYNEMQSGLCEAAAHNFRTLNAGNILISCNIAEKGRIAEIAEDFNPDVIYMDPARRGEGGKKVFLIEECIEVDFATQMRIGALNLGKVLIFAFGINDTCCGFVLPNSFDYNILCNAAIRSAPSTQNGTVHYNRRGNGILTLQDTLFERAAEHGSAVRVKLNGVGLFAIQEDQHQKHRHNQEQQTEHNENFHSSFILALHISNPFKKAFFSL